MKLYGTIQKFEDQDDDTLIVSGVASSEDVDSDGEVITSAAMKAALPDYMKFANIREMHQAKAAGVALSADVDEDGKTHITARIVDSEAIKKVKSGVYKGFSIGGKITDRDAANKSIVTGVRLSEISLVDRPANPSAVFSMYKADGIEGEDAETVAIEEEVQDETTEPEKNEPAGGEVDSTEKKINSIGNESVKKGFGNIGWLADLVASLKCVQESTEWEAAIEGDQSAIPAKLKEAVTGLAAILVEMVGEETAELRESTDADDSVAMAADTDDLEKAGARNSKADGTAIQSMHDSTVMLGATCTSEKAHSSTDLAKIQADYADLLQKNVDLSKKVDELLALPQPIKGTLNGITKSEDNGTAPVKTEEPTTPEGLIKQIHATGGKRFAP